MLICIDPGTRNTGWAKCISPIDDCDKITYGVLKGNEGIENHYDGICEKYYELLSQEIRPTITIIEFPEIWGSGSAKRGAANAKGDILKLTFLIGRYCEIAKRFGHSVELVTPTQWKGTAPKEIILQRIKEQLHIEPMDHAADAVGMILYKKGLLNKR